jgi:hypothetical protein
LLFQGWIGRDAGKAVLQYLVFGTWYFGRELQQLCLAFARKENSVPEAEKRAANYSMEAKMKI